MKQKINNILPKSEFARNVLTLMTGTTVAQAIPIAISPILTRIYTPEDFGVLALFVAITSILGSIANGRYELAIMLPKKEEDAINIFALGMLIVTTLSVVLLLIVLFFNEAITTLLKNDKIGNWLYFAPITVFFMGAFNMLNYFNNRKKYYKDIAKATVIKSIVLSIIQLSVGFLKAGATGLITGQIFSQFAANMRLLKNIIKDKVLIGKIKKTRIIAMAERYKKFPQFSMTAILANMLSVHLTNILVSTYYNTVTLGMYSLVQKILGVPTSLISNSIGQVYFQKATEEKQKTGTAIKIFDKTIRKLTLIGLPIFIVLFFLSKHIFPFIFGEEWRIAGYYAQIILPLYLSRFIIVAVTVSNSIFEKQKISFYWQLSLLFFSICVIVVANFYKIKFDVFLMWFSFIATLHYIALYFILKMVVKTKI